MDLLEDAIAVVGIACRFPGAKSKEKYWENLLANKESITTFSDEELLDFELEFDKIKNDPNFVKARGVIDDVDKWDAGFFNVLPGEAKAIDPQQRLWLENTWHAFEDAGINPYKYNGNIGVFAGSFFNTYLLNNVLRDPLKYEQYIRGRTSELFQTYISNDPMFLATKTAYHFNLKGPAINIQTACSTSLVAISQACSSLLSFESDVCVSGGVTVIVPQQTGYMYQEGAIGSPDGHCRPFDKDSKGTVFGNGVGTVVLKRLKDAVAHNDRIYSVIRGWATNNDGNQKMGFTAPGIEGQYNVISAAQSFAGVTAEEISYIEAHGTATPLGDPIEITALTKAFRDSTAKKQFCAIGSVKSNIGHLDVASGVAGLIKVALAAYYHKIPATLHYKEPNPLIHFGNSPFFVLAENSEWKESKPLIMGVSSFGVGGTNAHIILSDYKAKNIAVNTARPKLYLHSARSKQSLVEMNENLVNFLTTNQDIDPDGVAYTLQQRRSFMPHRSFSVVEGNEQLSKEHFLNATREVRYSKLVFMFPGQGAQYASMGKYLYNSEPVFKETADTCFALYKEITGADIRNIIFADNTAEANKILAQTRYTQPALFIIEYCTACLYNYYGIKADFYMGHSIGEYVAACLAGVFDLKSALSIVIKRGALMQTMPEGSMMAVTTNASNLEPLQGSLFEIAADNSHAICTISYKTEDETAIKTLLVEEGYHCIPLQTSHAFHSKDFDPILDEFSQFVDSVSRQIPEVPFISSLTGKFIEDSQAISGTYWAQQLRNTVLFKDGIATVHQEEDVVYLEVGPNTHLHALVLQNDAVKQKDAIIVSLGKGIKCNEQVQFYKSIGELWNFGIEADYSLFYKDELPQLVSLPSYPFEKQKHWINFTLNNASVNLTATAHNVEDEVLVENNGEAQKSSMDVITDIWKEIFGLEAINPTDDFIQLGGHSLLALQIITRVKDLFSVEIGLRDFLSNPTIQYLNGLVVENEKHGEKRDEISGMVHLSCCDRLPLTDTQKRLFFIAKLNDTSPAYNIPFTIKFDGELDAHKLQQGVAIVFNRHHIVNARFKSDDNGVYYTINEREVAIVHHDISKLPEDEKTARLNGIIGEDSRIVFDLENDVLYRMMLIKTAENEHYFHVTVHHIIFDGISCGVFIEELDHVYNALQSNSTIELPEIVIHQYDYADWESKNSDEEKYKASLHFWKNNLDGLAPLINFPTDRVRTATPSGKGIKEKIELSETLTKAIKEISKRENVTVFHTMLSAYSLLVQKYSSEQDFCIGSPIAHRPTRHLEGLIGMFVNTITFRYNYEHVTSFKDLIQYTKNITLDAITHQDLSFDKIVELVQPERHTLYNPIFQLAFSWQNFVADPVKNDTLTSRFVTIRDGISPFDLTFYMWEQNNSIEGEIECNIDIFDESTIARLKDNFIQLLTELTKDIEQPLSKVDFLDKFEKKQLLEWNNTDKPYEDTICIHRKLEEQTKLSPNAVALRWRDTTINYKEFNAHANRLAHYLINFGVAPDTLVGVCIERCPQMMIAIFAILKAGGAYLPIDIAIPEDRISTIVNDAEAALILTTKKSSGNIPKNVPCEIVYIDDIMDQPLDVNDSNPLVNVTSHNLAYVIYTSGSTGIPKGVMIEHHSVLNRIGWMQDEYPNTSQDVLIQKTPISFDVSVWELFWWTFTGSSLFILNPGDEKDPQHLIDAIKKHKVSLIHFVPSMFGAFVSYLETSERFTEITSLRNIFLSGEAFPPAMVNDFYTCMQGYKSPDLINLYGPTEATVDVSHFPCPRTTNLETMYIGKTIANTKLLVINKNNQIVPIGVPGELIITGVNLSRGYIKRDELNKEKFIEIDYLDGKKIRAYKTGDLVKMTETGNIFYIGRIDNQVKIRGYRIELGEIESDLIDIEHVDEAVVLAADLGQGMAQLVAFVKVAHAEAFSVNEAKNYLNSKLPAYMVPSLIIALDEFPLSANGKIDRKKLQIKIPAYIDGEKKEKKPADVEKLNHVEKQVFSIWSDVLKYSNFGVEDNFFDIGGNSLLAINLVEKVKKQFDINISLRIFFDTPTIKAYAQNINVMLQKKQNVTHTDNETFEENIISGEI